MNNRQYLTEERGYPPYRLRHSTKTTQVLRSTDPDMIPAVSAAIQRNEVIILPTDTVYGVGTNAFDEDAVRCLFVVKQRAREKGIPILIAELSDLEKIAIDIPPVANRLIARFWPGPLTLVLPKRPDLPPAISNSNYVAVRLPDHDVSREIIRAAGGALATTSANLSGRAPAQTVDEALRELAGAVTLAIDDGPSGGQVASTVVDCTRDEIRILRSGPLAMEDLLQVEQS